MTHNEGRLAKKEYLPVQLNPFPSLYVPTEHANIGNKNNEINKED